MSQRDDPIGSMTEREAEAVYWIMRTLDLSRPPNDEEMAEYSDYLRRRLLPEAPASPAPTGEGGGEQ